MFANGLNRWWKTWPSFIGFFCDCKNVDFDPCALGIVHCVCLQPASPVLRPPPPHPQLPLPLPLARLQLLPPLLPLDPLRHQMQPRLVLIFYWMLIQGLSLRVCQTCLKISFMFANANSTCPKHRNIWKIIHFSTCPRARKPQVLFG